MELNVAVLVFHLYRFLLIEFCNCFIVTELNIRSDWVKFGFKTSVLSCKKIVLQEDQTTESKLFHISTFSSLQNPLYQLPLIIKKNV